MLDHEGSGRGQRSGAGSASEAFAGDLTARLDEGLTRSFIEGLPGLFLLFDRRLRLAAWNRNVAAVTAFGEDELLRRTPPELVADESAGELTRELERVAEVGGVAAVEAPLVSADGRRQPYLFQARRFEDGGRVFLCVTGIDISDRKELEEQLLQSQKLEAIGALAGGIAHDFNNLLVPILGFAELSRVAAADHPEIVRHLENVTRAAQHARSLVANILAFSRKQSPGLETFDLRDPIDEVVTLLKSSAGRGITVLSSLPPGPLTVCADRSEIRQVVLNLCTNAIHAMREGGGTLGLSLTAEAVEGRRGGFRARLSVADEGVGIDDATRRRMFDPFFTTKPIGEGTGLGLSVVHGIVAGMDGTVEVDSDVGLGSTFHITIPLADAALEVGDEDVEWTVVRGRGESLMLVDDDPLVATAMQRQLEGLGYEVEAFIDSRAARRAFEGDPDHYDAVLTDYQMPHIGGLALARTVRERSADTPILLFSGFAEGLDPAEVRALRLTYLDKPADMPRLSAMLRRVLAGAVGG